MTNHPTSSRLRQFLGAALGVLVMTVGLAATASPASAAVVPTNEDGCPAGGDPSGALPCSTFALQCPKFGLEVRLANAAPAGANAVFRVTTPTTVEEYTLTPNETQFHTVHIGEDLTVHITVEELTTGLVFADGNFTRDCTNPSGSVGDVSCADGILVSVSNPGVSPADFHVDIYDGGSNVPTRTTDLDGVTGDSSTTVAPVTDGPIRIVVTATTSNGPGSEAKVETVADRSLASDCAEPTVSLTHACATGLDITVTAGEGQDETAFHITVTDSSDDVVLDDDITVPAGGSTTVNLPNPVEGETYTAAVTEAGQTEPILATDTIPVDCQEPTVDVSLACAEGGDQVVATVTTGPGQDETHFDVTFTSEIGIATLSDQEIPANSSADFPFASPGEGATITVDVRETGSDTVLGGAGMVVDCLAPTVTIDHECGDGDVVVTVTAPEGQDETEFTVVIKDEDGNTVVDEDVTVPAGESTEVHLPNPVDGTTYTVVVTEAGTTDPVVGSADIPVDCNHPAPSATATEKCATDATNGITVTVTTTDAEAGPSTFTVLITNQDGSTALNEDVTIEGAGSGQVVLSNPVEDRTSHVQVTTGDTTVLAADLHVDCVEVQNNTTTQNPPTEVLGTQTRRGSLATTGPVGPLGSDQLFAVSLGLILAGAGVAGLAGDKRRRTALVTWR